MGGGGLNYVGFFSTAVFVADSRIAGTKILLMEEILHQLIGS